MKSNQSSPPQSNKRPETTTTFRCRLPSLLHYREHQRRTDISPVSLCLSIRTRNHHSSNTISPIQQIYSKTNLHPKLKNAKEARPRLQNEVNLQTSPKTEKANRSRMFAPLPGLQGRGTRRNQWGRSWLRSTVSEKGGNPLARYGQELVLRSMMMGRAGTSCPSLSLSLFLAMCG